MIEDIKERVAILVQLGKQLRDTPLPDQLLSTAKNHNPWFTTASIIEAVKAIAENYLSENALNNWIQSYPSKSRKPKNIGLILAGNIPLVGIHDIISVFICGHRSIIKLSEKDTVLTKYILEQLKVIDERTQEHFQLVDRLVDYDAVIATGSNSSGRYFQKYFSKVPHIIRTNRNGVAVVYKDTSAKDLKSLASDILSYFGLGCRNVSKIYLQEGLDRARIFEALEDHQQRINHNKYKNNYDYSYALYLMSKEEFYTDDLLIMRPNKAITSRISVVHYEYFSDTSKLTMDLQQAKDLIQCIVTDRPLDDLDVFDFGASQSPALADYADGVNTLDFLFSI